MINQTIGQRIKTARKEKGYTQGELGTLISKAQTTVGQWERGELTNLSEQSLEALGDALGVNPAWLRYGDEYVNISGDDINKVLIKYPKYNDSSLQTEYEKQTSEKVLLNNFHSLNDDGKQCLIRISEVLTDTYGISDRYVYIDSDEDK